LKQSLEIFQQCKEEFQESYTNLMKISKINEANIENWKHFHQIYGETKD